MDQVAENYQLKWHSFSGYLHSCIATSLQSETFADVALVTIDGRQIMAHRFVLSACSQYLHQILKLQPRITTALPLMIILPPEINYRTMKTLIQYMYSGEATVSKDILELVLRGGDILKVKGLWRPKEDENHAPENNNKLVKVSTQHKNNNNNGNDVTTHKKHKVNDSRENRTSSPHQPKVLNYTINVMNNKNEKQNETTTNQEDVVTRKSTKPKQQNSVIKSTEEEKRAHQGKERKDTSSSSSNDADKMASSKSNESLQFLVIKEEPIEWTEVAENDMELLDEKEVFSTEMTIKPEIYMEDVEEPALYSPLTCELCTETFTLPAEWVRHVQTHTDMLPAKRQRRGKNQMDDESDAPFPQLHCDLCQKYFPTPAEWVHHIQNTHTEFELHLSNKTTPGKVVKAQRSSIGPAQNLCTICSKKFPSHASLLIHKRTHTGEKPYMCELCYKGFNVKSNLLRHLRTVHDKIINPTDVDADSGKEDNSTNNGD